MLEVDQKRELMQKAETERAAYTKPLSDKSQLIFLHQKQLSMSNDMPAFQFITNDANTDERSEAQ